MDVPEFQRQLCTPNVPKFANALISLAEKETNTEVYVSVRVQHGNMRGLKPVIGPCGRHTHSYCRFVPLTVPSTARFFVNSRTSSPERLFLHSDTGRACRGVLAAICCLAPDRWKGQCPEPMAEVLG